MIVHRLDQSVLFGEGKIESIILLSCFHLVLAIVLTTACLVLNS